MLLQNGSLFSISVKYSLQYGDALAKALAENLIYTGENIVDSLKWKLDKDNNEYTNLYFRVPIEQNISGFVDFINNIHDLYSIEIKSIKGEIIYNEDRYGRFLLNITLPFKVGSKDKDIFYNLKITKI